MEFQSEEPVKDEIVVDYNADTHYVIDHEQVKIPEHLLKSHEL